MFSSCPCGSSHQYLSCCGQYLSGKMCAPTPEALMRSRYTAFVKNKFNYLRATMRGAAAENFDLEALKHEAPLTKWLKLEVLRSQMDGDTGQVTFKAQYRFQTKTFVLQETSQFERVGDAWFYIGKIF